MAEDWFTEMVGCESCGVAHSRMEWHSLGMLCGRCGKHTGNNHQGHYWAVCKVLLDQGVPFEKALRELHFCCPGDCELEAAQPSPSRDGSES